MPPRRRPTADGAPVHRTADPAVHVPGFIQYLQAECGMAKNTVLAYRTDLEQFCEWSRLYGPEAIQQTNLGHLSNYLLHLRERKLAATSIARKLVSIKMFFRYLVLEGVLTESVADLVNSPKLWQYLPKVLSPEVTDKLLSAPTADDRTPLRDRALLAVLYATGCRASEVCGLTLRGRASGRGLLPLPRQREQGADRLAESRCPGRGRELLWRTNDRRRRGPIPIRRCSSPAGPRRWTGSSSGNWSRGTPPASAPAGKSVRTRSA